VSFAFGSSGVDNLTAAMTDSDFGFDGGVKSNSGGFATGGTEEGDAGNREAAREGQDLTGFVTFGLDVFLIEIDTFHENGILFGVNLENFSGATFVFSGGNLNGVVYFELIHILLYLDDLGSKRGDLGEAGIFNLTGNGAKDTSAKRLLRANGVDNNGGIVIKSEIGTVVAASFLAGANNDGFDYLLVLDGSVVVGAFDGSGNDVTDTTESAVRTAVDQNHFDEFGTGVVGNVEYGS